MKLTDPRPPDASRLGRRAFLGRTLMAAAALPATGVLGACGGGGTSSGSGKTVVFWHNFAQQARADQMRKIADAFERAHPGVTVKIEVVPFAQVPTKWPAAQAAGRLPDVMTLLPEHAVSMWQARALRPAGDLLSSLGGESAFRTGLIGKLARYDGEAVLVPFYVHNRLLVQRGDLLKKDGVTLPEKPTWNDAMTAATKLTHAPGQYGWMLKLAASDTGGSYLLYLLTRSTGGLLFDGTGKAMLDTPEVKRATRYLVELAKKASGSGQVNYTINDDFTLINTGKTALAEDSAAVIGTAVQQAPAVAANLTSSYFPRDTAPGHLLGAISVALPKGKNPGLGAEFAKFLYDPANYVPFLHTIPLFMFPTLTSAETAFYGNPTVKKYEKTVQQTLTGVSEGSAPGFESGPNPYAGTAFSGHVIEKALQSIIVGGASVDSALATANKSLQATFDAVRSRTRN